MPARSAPRHQWWSNIFALAVPRQLKELYFFQLFFSFAFSLITIFEPVFFYQLGIPLAAISLYYAIHYTLYIVLMPLGGKFAARFGVERSLAVSTPFFVLYFVLLALLPQLPAFFWVAVIVLTAHKIFYWPAYHADFTQFSDGKNQGTEQSWMRVITQGAGIAGPLLGGFIAAGLGFPALFTVAAGSALLAGVTLLRTQEKIKLGRLEYTAHWRLIFASRHRRMVIAMFGWAEDMILLVWWPIWLIMIVGSVHYLGMMAAAAVAVMSVWGFVLGELIDRRSARWVLRWGAPVVALGNLIRLTATTPLRAFFVNVGVQTASIGVALPFLVQLYKNGKSVGPLSYALAFETVLAISKAATAWGLVWLFATVATDRAFAATWWLGAVLSLLYGLL